MSELQLLNSSIADLGWFQKNSERIREEHEGEFIAIKNQEIIDSAPTASILIRKLEKEGEDSSLVLIKFVTPKGEIVIL